MNENLRAYKLISLLSCIRKVAEKLIAYRFVKSLDDNHIIAKQQSVFQPKRSTIDNLTFLTQKSVETLNRSKYFIIIFFYIAQAFEKLWHQVIKKNLRNYKVPIELINCF